MAPRREIICNRCCSRLAVSVNVAAVNCPRCQNRITFHKPQQYYNGFYPQRGMQPPPPPCNLGNNPVRAPQPQPQNLFRQPSVVRNRFKQSPPAQPDTHYLEAPPGAACPFPAIRRRQAVLCGVSYYGHPKALTGSVSNVRIMTRFLVECLGFSPNSILVLTEEEKDPKMIPTKKNMTMAMQWLVRNCRDGDSLVFYYSGHGSRVADRDGDEKDGFDEALCPLDFETEGRIIDDRINEILVRPLPDGVRLHAIVDTCRSGTILDLPYVCNMTSGKYYMWDDHRTNIFKGTSGGRAICLSACDDDQTSGDTTAMTGTATGALTHSFIEVLRSDPKITYAGLLNALRIKISETQKAIAAENQQKTPAIQVPQLSSSHIFEINLELFSV